MAKHVFTLVYSHSTVNHSLRFVDTVTTTFAPLKSMQQPIHSMYSFTGIAAKPS